MKSRVLVLAIALTLSGCCTEWKRSPDPNGPLTGEGKTAGQWTRRCKPTIVPTADWDECLWDVNGKRVEHCDVGTEVTQFLEASGYVGQLERTDGWEHDVTVGKAKHRFFIVSLEPTVVIMTDHDRGSTEDRGVGALTGTYIRSSALDTVYYYGNRVPEAEAYSWFSPGISKSITEAIRKEEGWEIPVGGTILKIRDAAERGLRGVTRTASNSKAG
ncbi:MAG: hypothetical protein ABL994_14445 [Verrucomicrobiales bacterium]